jgi:hypothetical protein
MPLRPTTLPSPPTSWRAITGPCVTCNRAAVLRPRLAAAPSALPGSQAAAHRGPRPRWQSPASPLISRALHRPGSAIGLAARPAPVARRRGPRRHDADAQLLLALLLPRPRRPMAQHASRRPHMERKGTCRLREHTRRAWDHGTPRTGSVATRTSGNAPCRGASSSRRRPARPASRSVPASGCRHWRTRGPPAPSCRGPSPVAPSWHPVGPQDSRA